MADIVFISYSRRDQEFVRRLASDLNERVDGVWFDQSDIQAGDRWRQRIVDGIRECKVFVLVVSPNSAASQVVAWELSQARANRKTIIPVIYRSARLPSAMTKDLREVHYIDLQRGSYADNFQYLVDALIAQGVAVQREGVVPRPFLREPVETNWSAVFGRLPGWGLAWGIGWGIFWFLLLILLMLTGGRQLGAGHLLVFPLGGAVGGALGGLLAGFITMLVLRRHAPSIAWKHMAPSIRIWTFSGPLGAFLSGAVAITIVKASTSAPNVNCSRLSFGDCLGTIFGTAFASAIAFAVLLILTIMLFVLIAWFVTGVFAGWLAVRHIRRLEPGIVRGQTFWVTVGWGTGAVAAAIGSVLTVAVLSSSLGLD